MKNIRKLFVLLIFLLSSSICESQVSDLIIGDNLKKDAKEVINEMLSRMDEVLQSAMDRGDFITEARLKEIDLMLDGTKNYITNERIKLLEDLDIQRTSILKGIDETLAGNLPDIYEINDLSAILTANIQDIVNNFGGLIQTKDKFAIYRINGISQQYKKTGLYKIHFIGNVFGKPHIKNKILINGQEKILHQSTNMNSMYVEFPSSEIESFFKLTEPSRIPIKIISVETKKKFMKEVTDTLVSFTNTILLHPKLPIQYELIEISKSYAWSESIAGERFEKYTVPNENTTITARTVDGTIIDEEKTIFYNPSKERNTIKNKKCPEDKFMRISLPGSSGSTKIKIERKKPCEDDKKKKLKAVGNWVSNPEYYSEGTSVRREYHSSSRKKVWIEVYYKKKIASTPVEIPRSFNNGNKGYLSYGVYESDYFTDDYASYRLKVKYFYDDWRIINPTSATTIKGIKTSMETGAIKRLTINITPIAQF